MPNIIIKNEYGEDELYEGVNTVRFLNESGGVVSFKHNSGETYSRDEHANQHRVRFIDYDGFVLKEVYVDSGDSVSYPDVNPSHEGITFAGWNWSEESLSSVTHDVDVGAVYDSVNTVIKLRKREGDSASLRLNVYSDGANEFLVDWGDGSTNTYSRTSSARFQASHTYEGAGVFTITLSRTSGTAEYWLGYNNKTGTSTTAAIERNNSYVNPMHVLSVCLSSDIKFIPHYCFHYLGADTILVPSSVDGIGKYAFYNSYVRHITLPRGVTSVLDYAFNCCYVLSSVSLPDTLTDLGAYLFQYCRQLKSLAITSGVSQLQNYVCAYCTSLKDVFIPDGVTSIGNNAFSDVYLRSVTIPQSVASIGTSALHNYSLRDVFVYAATPPALQSNLFGSVTGTGECNLIIHVPAGSVNEYKNATYWSTYAKFIVGDL